MIIAMAAPKDKTVTIDIYAKIIGILVGIILSLLCFFCGSLIGRTEDLSNKIEVNAKDTKDRLELLSKDVQEIKVSFATYQEKVKQLEKNDTVKP